MGTSTSVTAISFTSPLLGDVPGCRTYARSSSAGRADPNRRGLVACRLDEVASRPSCASMTGAASVGSAASEILQPAMSDCQAEVIERASVRVLVIGPDRRLLLLNTCDPARPGHEWWELPGGGIKPGEQPRDAAVREFYEETGIATSRLGPCLGRVRPEFSFGGCRYRQKEEVFLLGHAQVAILPAALEDDLEREAHLGHGWWRLEEVLQASVNFYPPQLPELYEAALPQLHLS
jgi:8-oxo-dGTP pyrophosphatase MutT (NUDIX family)